MPANLLILNSSKTEFLLIGLKQQLLSINTSSLNTCYSAHNLGFIFDEHLSFTEQIDALYKSCYSYIHQRHCVRPCLDFKTTSTIAAFIVHSKLDHCNSLYYNLSDSQHIQHTQKSFARAVVKAPKFSHVSHFQISSLA